MSTQTDDPPERFLSRWSRRKHEAARTEPATAESAPVPVPPVASPPPAAAAAPEPLPPVESLTIESDFTKFLSPAVDESVKRAALKKLFSDPRFNVMDGLDVYIDDYTKPDPMPEGMLAKLRDVYEKIEAQVDKLPEETQQLAEQSPPPMPAEGDVKDDPAT